MINRKKIAATGLTITLLTSSFSPKVNAWADTIVTDWSYERNVEFVNMSNCLEEVVYEKHYVYYRYLWHDGKVYRATSLRLVPSNYKLNKNVSKNDYSGVEKNSKKYNVLVSKEYLTPVSADKNGGYTVTTEAGVSFHAWCCEERSIAKYRYVITDLDESEKVLYDGKAAADFALLHWDDKYGKCSAFVARCLAAGGLAKFAHPVDNEYEYAVNSPYGGVGYLEEGLLEDGLATKTKVVGTYLNKTNYPNVKEGDVVIWIGKSKNGSTYKAHAAIISGFDKDGNALFAAHNNPHKADKMKTCYKFGPDNISCDMYVYEIKR